MHVVWITLRSSLLLFPLVKLSSHFSDIAFVHDSTNGTNGTNGIPISFKVIPMVPLVIPLVPRVMPMVPFAQWFHWENPKQSHCKYFSE